MSNYKFWMLYGEGAAAPQYKHSSFEDAQSEAERLSSKHQGKKFYVLEAVGVARSLPQPIEFSNITEHAPIKENESEDDIRDAA